MAYLTNTIKNVEGTSISINDSYKLKDLTLEGDTTQDGTPTPDNPVPIEVVTGEQEISVVGKNLFDYSTNIINNSSFNNTTMKIVSDSNSNLSYCKCEPNTTYTISRRNPMAQRFHVATTENIPSVNSNILSFNYNNSATSITITTPSNAHYIVVRFIYNEKADYETYAKTIQIEKGSTATDFEEYKGQSYEINLGKQLFDKSKATTGKGISTSNGGLYNNTDLFATDYIEITPNTSYVVNGYSTSANRVYGACYDASKTFLVGIATSANISTFKVTNSSAKYIRLTGLMSDIDTYQLEKGTVSTPFSTYKTPIELCKIGNYKDYIKKSSGKNLFDKGNANILNAYINGTTNKIVNNANARTLYISCQPNTTYTVSRIAGQRFIVGDTTELPTNDVTLNGRVTDNTGSNITITTKENSNYLCVFYYLSSADTLTEQQILDSIMLNEGTTALPYEPYGTNWYIEKQIGKVVLNGSESWSVFYTGASNWWYQANNVITANNTESVRSQNKCNRYVYAVVGTSTTNQGIWYGDTYIRIRYGTEDTVANFKSWLSSNNVIVYYVLKTPTYTTITDTELINQLESIRLLEGFNNISISSANLSSPINFLYYSTDNPYLEKIYSQDDKNDLKIWFDDVELQDSSRYCEKITRTARILPDDGSKRFSLDNFISTSVEVILHNVDIENIKDQVKISIGTLVGNEYTYIPLGVFNIQDKPEKDGNKITLKLRDNRVKFDFNYNAKPLIDEEGGSASKKQILNDICKKAGVKNCVLSFNGENDILGIYDNTIQASTYISYLMEQAGLIPTIDRNGNLIAIDLSNVDKWKIPLSIVESYEKGEPYSIDRVVYESGVIKYQTSEDESLNTLYINGANPYIFDESQVLYILNKLKGFEIDSITTKRVLGNPAIDPYDIIEIYNDIDGTNDIVFRTLANTEYTYNGVHRDTFDTTIGKEERTENVSKNSEATYRKSAKTEIDNINANISLLATSTEQYQTESNNKIENLIERTNTVEQTLTSTQATIEVMQRDIIDGQETLRNNLVTIDINGLNVSTSSSKISTNLDNNSFDIKDNSGNTLTFIGYDEEEGISKAQMDNLTVTNYFVAGYHRTEKMNIDGEYRTGDFYIGG